MAGERVIENVCDADSVFVRPGARKYQLGKLQRNPKSAMTRGSSRATIPIQRSRAGQLAGVPGVEAGRRARYG